MKRSPLRNRSLKRQRLMVERRQFVIDLLDERNHQCEARVENVCTGWAVDVHEKLRRSQGGQLVGGDMSNYLIVCRACHTWIGLNPNEAVKRRPRQEVLGTMIKNNFGLALCKGKTDLFFSEKSEDMKKARSICKRCPERDACLQWALEHQEAWGIWAGLDYHELRIVAVSLGYEPPSRKLVEHGTERGWAWHRRQKRKDNNHVACQPCIDAYNQQAKVRVARYRKNKSGK